MVYWDEEDYPSIPQTWPEAQQRYHVPAHGFQFNQVKGDTLRNFAFREVLGQWIDRMKTWDVEAIFPDPREPLLDKAGCEAFIECLMTGELATRARSTGTNVPPFDQLPVSAIQSLAQDLKRIIKGDEAVWRETLEHLEVVEAEQG